VPPAKGGGMEIYMNKEDILEKSRAENRIGIKIFMRKRF